MSNQILKLRRSAVPGKVPDTGSIELGEIALNTYDGRAFMKKSGSSGEEIIELAVTYGSVLSASFSTTASYLEGFDPNSYVLTSSFNSFTSSYQLASASFDTRITNRISGSQGYIPYFSSSNDLGNSIIHQSSSTINISGSLKVSQSIFNPGMQITGSNDNFVTIDPNTGEFKYRSISINTGTSGQSGTAGSSGQSGTNGTAGSAGSSGQSGTNGTAGSAGSSGTSVSLSGSIGYFPKYDSATHLTYSSSIYEDASGSVSIGTTSSYSQLHIEGDFSIRGSKYDYFTASIAQTTQSIVSLPTSSFDGAYFDYVIERGNERRAGTITATWNTLSEVDYNEVCTTDVGLGTEEVDLLVGVESGSAHLYGYSSTNTWTVKVIMRAMGNGTSSPGTYYAPGGGGSGSGGASGTSGTSGTSGQTGASGTSGSSGGSGADGTSGSSGQTGSSGTSGAGSPGTSGSSGQSGTSGSSGGTGASGSSGSSGNNGTSGSSGGTGASGTSGSSGQSGTSGSSGSSGATGTSGSSGSTGSSGSSGQSGTSGSSGTSGTSGISGQDGNDGTDGLNGTAGTSGAAGTSGSAGSSGTGFTTITNSADNRILTAIDANSANAEANFTFSGSLGTLTGSLLISGSERISGSLEVTGSIYNKDIVANNTGNFVNVDLATGKFSYTVGGGNGTSGTAGSSGSSNGSSGSSGQSGTSGSSGNNGTSGSSGNSGSSGSSGVTGTSGSSGGTGTSGSSGANGTSGSSGSTGTSGSSGVTGTSGSSGSSGNSGTSGSSGETAVNQRYVITGTDWDFSAGNFGQITLTNDVTLTISNTNDLDVGVLTVIQDSTGSHDLTVPGITPADWEILTGTSSRTIVSFLNDNSTIYWSMVAQYPLIELETPTLTATVISDTEIDLSWTNVSNESSYKLEWSPNGSTSWTQIGGTIAANTTTYNHTGLTASTHYYYRITAVGDGVIYSNSGYGTDDDTTNAGLDTDAQTYITAQETVDTITIDTTNRDAINQLFLDLKAGSNPFAQGKALYLFYGTTILNALSPTNDDAHFRATPSGGPVIDATGITLDGVNDYLNTHVNPSLNLATNSESYAWYNGINSDPGCDIGVYVGSGGTAIFSKSSGNLYGRLQQAGDVNLGANASSIGRYVVALRSTDIGGGTYSRRVLKNGTQFYENPSPTFGVTNGILSIGAYNTSGGGAMGTPGGYRNARYGIFWIGLELSNTQMADLDTAISNFITATSRT